MKGFTALELVIVVAVIGLIAALAVPVYRGYITNTETIDGLETIAVLTEQLAIKASTEEGVPHVCDDLLVSGNLDSVYMDATITPMANGEAGLSVTAKVDTHGTTGVAVAKALHDELIGQNHNIEVDVLGDSLASYTVMLTTAGRPFCGSGSASPQPQIAASAAPAASAPAPALPDPATLIDQSLVDYDDDCDGNFDALKPDSPFNRCDEVLVQAICAKSCAINEVLKVRSGN